jgi:hypothetical protein
MLETATWLSYSRGKNPRVGLHVQRLEEVFGRVKRKAVMIIKKKLGS